MVNCEKWTVRNISPDAYQMLREVSEYSHMTFGDALSEAVTDWYNHLPEIESEKPKSVRKPEWANPEQRHQGE